ncbi:MAG: ATP-dependent Clp protease proteolytic subunit [Candidatus Yanofskybacteria bacterium]|nr:ATP-dependent Clp protease proteolytic subunit [Candidatus Yanofskybacteria bacterium]
MIKEESILAAGYKERFIWLDGEINPTVAYQFKRMLAKLNKLKIAPMVFYISGPGGDTHAGFSMMNEIIASDSPVIIVAHGIVTSGCFTITQTGAYQLALPGTKFTFHPAELQFKKNLGYQFQLTQSQLIENLERLRLVDSVQLSWLIKRGRPTKEIFDLFRVGATISLPKARKLHLIDGYYKTEDFLRDKRIVRKIKKAK